MFHAAALLAIFLAFRPDVASAAEAAPLKVALFVDNRAGSAFDDKVPVLEDFLASRIAGMQMQVLSRQIVLDALKNYSAGSSSTGDTPGRVLDRTLSDNTSALRLAQNLGADYVLVPTLATYGKETRTYAGSGIKSENTTHTLRVSYRLAEAARGGEISGDNVTVSRTYRRTGGLQIESSEVLNELLDEAAEKLSHSIVSRRSAMPAVAASSSRVTVAIQTTITDFASLQLSVSDHQPGEKVDMVVLRKGEELQLELVIGHRDEE